MANKPTTKTLYATRDFNDAGTGAFFEAGKPVQADDGALANYRAASLVSEGTATTAPPADPAA